MSMSERVGSRFLAPGCEECSRAEDHFGHYADVFVLGECGGTHLYECSKAEQEEPCAESSRA